MVMIIHKPSFTNAVTMNQVPMYLLYVSVAQLSKLFHLRFVVSEYFTPSPRFYRRC